MELDPVVSRHPGWVGWGLSAALRPSPSSPPPHPQEGRLVEKESSEWQLQGQPTVLLTLAHIFHHFAPLLVRGCEGGERPRLRAGVLRCVRSSRLTWQDPHDQSSQTSRMSWGSGGGEEEMLPAEGIGLSRKDPGVVTSEAKGTAFAEPQRGRGAAAFPVSPSDPGRAPPCLRGPPGGPGAGWGGGGGRPERDRKPPPHQHPALVQCEVYVVEAVLMSFLLGVVEAGPPEQAQTVVHHVLDLLWLFMEVRPGRGRCGQVLEKAARTAGSGLPSAARRAT